MATATRELSLSNPTSTLTSPSSQRLMCLDIFRGLMVAGMIIVDNPGSDTKAYWPIIHAEWNGWTPADFIFPSFLFLVGISLDLAAVALELWSGRRGQIIALAACIVGYWAILRFVPVPGYGMPGRDIPFMDPDRNLAAWLDRKLFMGHLYNTTRDPEGILHTIPAIGTTLAGVLTGHWLRSTKSQATKAWGMLLIGIAGLVAGLLWNRWFPINKNLWTSSFALFTAGAALVFLAFLYWILEIRQWRGAWTMPILVFGMNAIVGFVADSLVYGPGYTFTVKGPGGASLSWHDAAQARLESFGLSTPNASLVYSLGALAFCWILLWLLWRKRIFVKV